MTRRSQPSLVVGWREWVGLAALGVDIPVRAKVDTGATTSSLHAPGLKVVDGRAEFWVHPHQRSRADAVHVSTPVVGQRRIRSSNGASEMRVVIATPITLGTTTWEVEVTLTRRDAMGYRMLLGRAALKNRAVVDVARSHACGLPQPADVEPADRVDWHEAMGSRVAPPPCASHSSPRRTQ